MFQKCDLCGRYIIDGSDSREVCRCMRRDDRALAAVSRLPPRETGRNMPCWCGSGKKYKRCCL